MDYRTQPAQELLRACTERGDPRAWEEFVRRFHPVIASTVLRTARGYGVASYEFVDDLIQETYLRLCANRYRVLREFDPNHADAIFGLLRAVAFSVTQDHFRSGLAQKRGRGQVVQLDGEGRGRVAPESGHVERKILLDQIDEILQEGSTEATEERDRSIFWLYYRQGMTTRSIAAIPALALTQKGVESAIHRLTRLVREHFAPGDKGAEEAKGKPGASTL